MSVFFAGKMFLIMVLPVHPANPVIGIQMLNAGMKKLFRLDVAVGFDGGESGNPFFKGAADVEQVSFPDLCDAGEAGAWRP